MNSPARYRDVLLVLLAVATGATDATAFLRLGHAFASVITGNLVLVGVGAARADGQLALFAGSALGGYALGVILAAPRRSGSDSPRSLWPAGTSVALGADIAFLVAFAVLWEIDPTPARGPQVAMLVLCAAAMGVQSTAVRRLGQVSTTYLTSTLTGLLEALVNRRWPEGQTRSLGIILAAVGGAAAAAAVVSHAPRWVPVLQLAPLVVVELASVRLVRAGIQEA